MGDHGRGAGVGDVAGRGHEDGVDLMNAKKVVMLVVVALVLFYVISQPTQAAQAVQGLFSWLRDGAEAIITFLKNLFA
ncbi:hypothetical protein JOD54_005884 [Actinokineospora baliensis]|uniref:hypothetical protein n=1 Tax=Actinokineospora baliensis TaxID=547056 RepID=UPI001958C1E2|nr:hypothetical protein [Actinokineospora baliensis]MBM7775680.1 hypothetical protein [Actinokineospora baliensis]